MIAFSQKNASVEDNYKLYFDPSNTLYYIFDVPLDSKSNASYVKKYDMKHFQIISHRNENLNATIIKFYENGFQSLIASNYKSIEYLDTIDGLVYVMYTFSGDFRTYYDDGMLRTKFSKSEKGIIQDQYIMYNRAGKIVNIIKYDEHGNIISGNQLTYRNDDDNPTVLIEEYVKGQCVKKTLLSNYHAYRINIKTLKKRKFLFHSRRTFKKIYDKYYLNKSYSLLMN